MRTGKCTISSFFGCASISLRWAGKPTTFDASTTPPPGLRVHARRPAQAATPLDVFLRLRGLDAHADVLYGLGARKIGDLRYLRKEDYAGVGLDLGDLDMKVQF